MTVRQLSRKVGSALCVALAGGLKIAALLPFLLVAVLFTTGSALAKAARRLLRALRATYCEAVSRRIVPRIGPVTWPRVNWQSLKLKGAVSPVSGNGLEPILRLFRHHYNREEKIFFGLVGLQLTTLLVGTAVAFIEVESIVLTGPLLSAVGFVVAFLAVRRLERPLLFVVFGLSPSLVTYLCFVAIATLELSPREASEVIPPILVVYTVVASYVAFRAAGQTPLEAERVRH